MDYQSLRMTDLKPEAETMTERNDIKLHYEEKGAGTTLILLHGNGEDGSYFVHQMDYFSERYRVIALDTRGHGKSPRGDKPFTIRQFAEDLRAFLDEQGIERADLLGFSDGGNIALIFAMRYPQRVGRLVLNGANLYSAGVKPSVQIPIILEYRITSFLAGRKKAGGKKKGKQEAARKAELLGLMVNDPDIRREELSENRDPEFIRIPKLVIAGDKDMIKDEHTRLIYASLPNAQIRVMKGSHFIAKESPDEFNRIVDEFLNDAKTGGSA